MMRLFLFMMMFSISLFSTDLTFQVYVFDDSNNDLLQSDDVVEINAMFVDSNDFEYLEQSFDQIIENGIIHITFSIDTDTNDLFVFDQLGLKLRVELDDDYFDVDISSDMISVYSKLADRISQVEDTDVLIINYDDASIGVGTSETGNALIVSGNLMADKFIGDGYYIHNVMGLGLNDDHSLENNMSRTMPNKTAQDDSEIGVDALYISNDPRVGIGTLDPKMSLDVQGLVLFQDGEHNTGILNFPLDIDRSMIAWDHSSGAFKAGYVSQSIGVSVNAFANASVAIGNDIVTIGWNSAIFGGESNSVYGDYSAIVGGRDHLVSGNYSVVIGGENNVVNDGYIASIGGEDNVVSSNFSILLSSTSNILQSGTYNTIYGSLNEIYGDSHRNTIFSGFSNRILDSDDVIIIGDHSEVGFDSVWVVNLTDQTVSVDATDQVIFYAENGLSYNTSDVSGALNVSGNVQADYFYGDGSQLTNISLVDKYWFMYGQDMTIVDYYLFVDTLSNLSEESRNRLNLNNGLILSDDGSRNLGSISFTGYDLIGTTSLGDISLIQQDTDSLYEFSSEFESIDDSIGLVKTGAFDSHYLMFNGDQWIPSTKNYWVQTATSVSYDRPIAFWSNLFEGMVSLMSENNQQVVFSDSVGAAGVSFQNIPMRMGFNMKSLDSYERFDTSSVGYVINVDTIDLNYSVESFDGDLVSIMSINRYGDIDFFSSSANLDVGIPTQSQVSNLIVDESVDSQLRHVNLDAPFLHSDASGVVTLQSENESTINFRILTESGSITTMNRLQITDSGEFLFSDSDLASVGQSMITIPDGELLMDNEYYIGVFDESRVFDVGAYFQTSSIDFVLDENHVDFFSFGQVGGGVRVLPDSILSVKDQDDTSFYLTKGNSENSIIYSQSQSVDPMWEIKRSFSTDDYLEFNTAANNALTLVNNKLYINEPFNPSQEINVEGDVVFYGDLNLSLTGVLYSEQPFIRILSDQVNFQPLDRDSGMEFVVLDDDSDVSVLKIKEDVVGIYNYDSNYSLKVDTGTYILSELFLYDEVIHHKTINDSISNSYEEIANISFDDASGYTTTQLAENIVLLEYQNHFSTFNTVTVDAVLGVDSQYITPNGVDLMGFEGEYISVFASDVTFEAKDDYSQMDSLEYYNDLSDGGVIDGDLNISATLNVTGMRTENGVVTSNKFIGDVHQIDHLPFPFTSTNSNVYFNDDPYNFQFIDNVDETIHVGILTSSPGYPLEVEGDVLVNDLISFSINSSGFLDPFDEDWALTFRSSGSNLVVTVNLDESSDVLFRLNDFEFNEFNSAHFVGLNFVDTDYRLSLFSDSVRDSESSYVGDVLLHGSDKVRLSMVDNLLDKFHLYLDNDSELFYLDGYAGIERLSLIAGNSGAITLSKYHDLGIGILTDALNDLVVSGNVVIGESYSGVYSADPNSIIVESKLGVGTPLPLYTSDIRGTVVIGDISPGSDIANSLIIEDQLFVEEYGDESVVAMGAIGLDGDLFFKDSDNELSFMNGDGEFVIGYSDSFYSSNLRSLNVISSSEIQLYPTSSTVGFYINSVGNVNFGHDGVNVNNNFHIEMDGLNLKIHQSDSGDYGDAQIEFESLNDGVIGLDSNYNNGTYQYFIISDEEILEDSITGETSQGADIQIDSVGNVDIGYNMHDSDENADIPDSSDQFRLDVNASMFSTQYGVAQNALTHMPIGSVIMWSGWTTELPEGWKFCTGVPSETTTDACNFIDQFIVGYDPSIGRSSLNPDGSSYVGSDSLTISSSDGSSTFAESFEHTHNSSWDSSSHDHAVNGTVSHGHSSNNTVEYSGSASLGTKTVSRSLASTGEQYITVSVKYTYQDCWKINVGFKVKMFCEEKTGWRNEEQSNTTHGATTASESSHTHTVTVDHNHSYSFNNESSHKHTMDTIDHSHANSLHTHFMDNRPSFYTLAFIYLEGE